MYRLIAIEAGLLWDKKGQSPDKVGRPVGYFKMVEKDILALGKKSASSSGTSKG